jgi:Domain of unknown function (DUF4389)
MTTMAPPSSSSYPMRLDIQYAESLSRLTFVKWILAIPHYLIIYALNIVFEIISLIAFFAILFTGVYPRSLFDFAVNTQRWRMNLVAYVMLIRNEYPPFSFEPGLYPVTFEVDYPTNLQRFAPLYKWILAIPHFIIVAVLGVVAFILVFVAGLAVLFTGKYPEGMYKFVVGVQRWTMRATLYALFMTDAYPPFSLDP